MPARIMDGTSLAQALLQDTTSNIYVRMKRNRCPQVGVDSRSLRLPAGTITGELVDRIAAVSADPTS